MQEQKRTCDASRRKESSGAHQSNEGLFRLLQVLVERAVISLKCSQLLLEALNGLLDLLLLREQVRGHAPGGTELQDFAEPHAMM